VRLPNLLATIDSARDVGQYTSSTIGADGLPIIAYYDVTNERLKVAHCTDLACTGRTVSTLDDRGRVGQYASVAIGTDGLPLISYYDATNQSLKVAHCDDRACSNALISTLDQARGGRFGAITIGSDGLGLIAYFSEPPAAAAVAHCRDQACSKASITILPRPNYWDGIDQTMAVAVGIDGLPLIAFSMYHITIDGTEMRDWVAHCSDVACSAVSLRSFDQWVRGPRAIGESQPLSLAIGPDGMGLIAYSRGGGGGVGGHSTLHVAHCALPDCSTWDLTQIKPGFRESYPYDTGLYPSISVRPGGLPSISFYDYGGPNPRLQLASCLDPLCDSGGPFTRPGISTLDVGADVGQFGSMTVGVDGLPFISYYDATNGHLKVLHCGSPQCISYQRQR
jgi:hypothetical protein